MRQHALNYEALAAAIKSLESNTNHRFAEVSKVLDALLEHKHQHVSGPQSQKSAFLVLFRASFCPKMPKNALKK
jgi:hypothetical protein